MELLRGLIVIELIAVLSVAVGLAGRRQIELLTQLRTQRDLVEVLQERETHAALASERTRIARELHDVVAHHISALLIQARAGQRMAERSVNPPEAERWGSVAEVAGETLHSMRRMVGLLRTDDDDPARPIGVERSPQPGLADLDQLALRTGLLGLQVHVSLPADVKRLPADIQLAAYRISQEAVTNAMRHASATRVSVTVSQQASTLVVEVADDGQMAGDFRPGMGLLGMRERVASFSGQLDLVAEPGRGFRVHARLPLLPAPEIPVPAP